MKLDLKIRPYIFVVLVRNNWNDIIEHLEKWMKLKKDIEASADPCITSLIDNDSRVKWGKAA